MAAATKAGILTLLAESYDSSSEDEHCQCTQISNTKRKNNENETGTKKITLIDSRNDSSSLNLISHTECSTLPRVPASICTMFSSTIDSHIDDNSLHQGRTRSFQHEAGNWATHVYIPLEAEAVFHKLVECVTKLCSSSLCLQNVDNFHLSISRTVVIRHHWIEPLSTQLYKNFSHFSKFLITLKFLDVYTNDDETRTFIAIKPEIGFLQLKNAADIVDECYAEFKLPGFYKPPSFHVSIVWCVGDKREEIIKLMPQLQEACEDFIQRSSECRNLLVNKIELKSGNKTFNIPLK